jgi:S-adenosylmethionine:tRNA ribosyltransferase-isomerase
MPRLRRAPFIETMQLADFNYDLPEALIAQHPTAVRSASRLLHIDPARTPPHQDRLFTDLPDLLRAGDLLIMNDTQVIKARLRGRKASGGRIEVLIERITDSHHALAMVRASHAPAPGSVLYLEGAQATVEARSDAFCTLRFNQPLLPLLEQHGALPLPPYIQHPATPEDEQRYQTVWARNPGAVAAPTAGLHFDEPMLERLKAQGIGTAFITLHVGAGTFLPVRTADPAQHVMHLERFHIPPETVAAVAATRERGGRIVAVGTTSLRALESAADPNGCLHPGWSETQLFIRPGYIFKTTDLLLTNFHLPQSTLLMLVSAFAGLDVIREAYQHAVAQKYRFFSYGDATLLEPLRPPLSSQTPYGL